MKSAPSASAPKAPPVQSVPGDKQNLGKYRDEVERLQLESNALDLDLNGFTVVEDVLDPDLTARGLEATLCTFGERTGTRPDVKTGKDYDGYHVQRYLLLKDPAYEEIVMAEKVLALVDFLLESQDSVLSTVTGHIRGQGKGTTMPTGYLPLHGDDAIPNPNLHNSVTVNICLTDVKESGCLAFVPGSHRWVRQPVGVEKVLAGDNANTAAVPCVAPAGSAIIWPSQTWHGSWEAEEPGIRVTMAVLYSRPYIATYELYRESVPDEMPERNSARFATLVGMDTWNGWNDNQDDWAKPWGQRDRTRYKPSVG